MQYDSRDDVYKANIASFTAKEVEKIKAKGVPSFYNRKFKRWHCPYCTTKAKPKDGRFDHLVSHEEDVASHEVALPLLHHQAKAKGWPKDGRFDQVAACCPHEGPDSGVM